MRVTLHTTAGPDAGRRIDLRNGLTARIGQSEWSDFSFASDPQMAEVHFTIRCEDDHCDLQVPQQTHPTSLNGELATDSRLHTGDKIRAGATEFVIDIEGDSGRHEDADLADVAVAASAIALGAAPLASYLELDASLTPIAEASATDDEFLTRLVEAEEYQPASRVQAHLFDNRTAVAWGCLCVDRILGNSLAGEQQAAREAAGEWVADPTEDNRRAAEAATERAGYAGPGGTLAAAAFWSGNLAPPQSPEPIPPDDRLTGQAVANAILFACVAKQPERMQEKLKECLQIARDLVDGKMEL